MLATVVDDAEKLCAMLTAVIDDLLSPKKQKEKRRASMIKTERLQLRPFAGDDMADVLEYMAKPAVNRFACMRLDSLEDTKAEMKKRAEDEYYFDIVLMKTSKVIGGDLCPPGGREPARRCSAGHVQLMLDAEPEMHRQGLRI